MTKKLLAASPSAPQPTPPWHTHLTLDTLLLILSRTLFHPFPAFILPLSLRAFATPFTDPSFVLTSAYFILVSLCHVCASVSHRVAYGAPREVDLEEEVVVISGGARGLGLCVAEIYGMRGGNVAVLDLEGGEEREEGGEDREGGEERGDGVRFYQCDVGDRRQVEKVWARIVAELGTPTVLINNAAIAHKKRFLDLTPEEIETTFRSNTFSHYYLTSLFLRAILARPTGGTLITVASVIGHLGASHLSAYSASKAALIAFHASISAELASTPQVKTILVAPGQLNTRMFAEVRLGSIARFWAPLVEVREVAVRLVAMIDEGEGGVLALPAYARWIAWMAVLPAGVQKVLRGWSGVDTAIEASRKSKIRTD